MSKQIVYVLTDAELGWNNIIAVYSNLEAGQAAFSECGSPTAHLHSQEVEPEFVSEFDEGLEDE